MGEYCSGCEPVVLLGGEFVPNVELIKSSVAAAEATAAEVKRAAEQAVSIREATAAVVAAARTWRDVMRVSRMKPTTQWERELVEALDLLDAGRSAVASPPTLTAERDALRECLRVAGRTIETLRDAPCCKCFLHRGSVREALDTWTEYNVETGKRCRATWRESTL